MIQYFLIFLLSFLVSYFTMPILIKFANQATIFANPNERSCHTQKIPNLGGIGIFLGMMFSIMLITPNNEFANLQYLLVTQMIIFFLGLKDDIFILSARNKLAIQAICAIILMVLAKARITNFYGTLGIYELDPVESYIFTFITIIGLVNAFNLIDGINWLAGLIAISTCSFLSFWFITNDFSLYGSIALSIIGSVIAFLIYNKTPAKIFMGDTGSLLLGLTITYLIIKFINLNHSSESLNLSFRSAPTIAISLFFIPILDTLRVFILRISKRKSPFSPDKNHIHHILLKRGYSHIKSSVILFLVNTVCIIICVVLNQISGKIIIPTLFVVTYTAVNLLLIRNFNKTNKSSILEN